jgi:hypothetical protein
MLRRLLVAYLVFVTAAGPALCCCSLSHLAVRLANNQAAEELPPCCQPPASAPEEDECECCRTQKPAPDERPRQDNCPQDDGPREGGCPCHENGHRPALIDERPDGPDAQPVATHWLSPAPPVLFDGPAASAFGAPASHPPPLSATDKLHVLHRLLC